MSADPALSATRRWFLRWLGIGGAWSLAGGPLSFAADPPAGSKSRAKEATKPPATPATPAAEEISADARELAAMLRRRYPDHIRAEDVEGVAKDIDGDLKSAKRLRDVKLENSVEPDVTFKA